MHLFDSFLVREDCLTAPDQLQQHANVQHMLRLPRGWVLYEFHHELFQDPEFLVEGVWREKMIRFPELRQARIEMLNLQRALLAPWYAKKKKPGDADAIVASEVCPYRIASLSRMKWVDFLPAFGWGLPGKFTITLEKIGGAFTPALNEVLEDWSAIGRSSGELNVSDPQKNAGSVTIQADCSYYSGHWQVFLWALLSDARWKTGIERMRITATQ